MKSKSNIKETKKNWEHSTGQLFYFSIILGQIIAEKMNGKHVFWFYNDIVHMTTEKQITSQNKSQSLFLSILKRIQKMSLPLHLYKVHVYQYVLAQIHACTRAFYFLAYPMKLRNQKTSRRKFIFTSETRAVIGKFNSVTVTAEFSHKFTPLWYCLLSLEHLYTA